MTLKPDHPVFSPPADLNIKIWRYMDLSKYLSFLNDSALFFSRADYLGDPYEGANSHANRAMRPSVHGESACESMFTEISSFQEWARQWTFVNCWHMNEHESDAMWRIYARTSDAVAIQSTFSRLQRAISGKAHLGVVRYIDYSSQWMPEGNTYSPFVHKRLSFEHEHELRAVIQAFPKGSESTIARIPNQEKGRSIPVSILDLIENVFIAPTSPGWFRDLVKNITAKYGIRMPVEQSALDRIPEF